MAKAWSGPVAFSDVVSLHLARQRRIVVQAQPVGHGPLGPYRAHQGSGRKRPPDLPVGRPMTTSVAIDYSVYDEPRDPEAWLKYSESG